MKTEAHSTNSQDLNSSADVGRNLGAVGAMFMVFLCCWLFLRYVSKDSAIAFGVAMICAVSTWFIRCERCHSSIYYEAGGRRFPSYGAMFLIRNRCPHCGLERL